MRRFVLSFAIASAGVPGWAVDSHGIGAPSSSPTVTARAPDQIPIEAAAPAAAVDAELRRAGTFAELNAIRQRAGAGLLTRSAALDAIASRHVSYLDANGLQSAKSVHAETAGLAGYSGSDPFVRMRSAGYRFKYATEVIGDIGSASPESNCIDDLMDTVYHAAMLLSRVTQAGLAYGSGRNAGMCTIDLGTPADAPPAPVLAAGAVIVYPPPGSTVPRGTYFNAIESPRPSIALLANAKAGTPVLVGFRNVDYLAANPAASRVAIKRFSLSDAAGTEIPSVVLADDGIKGDGVSADMALRGGFAVLVPIDPLPAGRYTVTLHASVTGGQRINLSTWWFRVAAP